MEWYLTFILTVIGLSLTWLQFRIKSEDHKFKLYDRRVKLYSAVAELLSEMLFNGEVTQEILQRFESSHRPCLLLFPVATRDLINDVHKTAVTNMVTHKQLEEVSAIEPTRVNLLVKCRNTFDDLATKKIPLLLAVIEKEITPVEELIPFPRFFTKRLKSK